MARRTVLAGGLASLLPARLAAQALRQGATAPGIRIAPDQEAMVPVNGGRIYVRVNGALAGAKPPILFIHGGPGSSHWGWLNATALATLADWKEKYADLPMDLADASLLWLAQQTGVQGILTIDLKDFSVYRLANGKALTVGVGVPTSHRWAI